jgi:hypothetical protein
MANTVGFEPGGTFGDVFSDCNTGERTIFSGDVTLGHSDDLGTQTTLNAVAQRERPEGGNPLRGWFRGGYVSRANVNGPADGHADGAGVGIGLSRAHLGENGLSVTYHLAAGVGDVAKVSVSRTRPVRSDRASLRLRRPRCRCCDIGRGTTGSFHVSAPR